MRDAFVQAMIAHAAQKDYFFLTGDLGFAALEPLRDTLGDRFINCGIAEQNMVGVAAGLAHEGHEVWIYSIAPFCYARPFEQIRNDLCLNHKPVNIVGNGGGYAYGAMGPTHHAIEDYGALLTLQNFHAFVPCLDEDLSPVISAMSALEAPAYLRLGRDEWPKNQKKVSFAPWREISKGEGPVVVACGPIAGAVVSALAGGGAPHPHMWGVSSLPLSMEGIPSALLDRIISGVPLMIVEEHVRQGGVGMMLTTLLAEMGAAPKRLATLTAQGYPSGRYGSQAFHRHESGLDADSIRRVYQDLCV